MSDILTLSREENTAILTLNRPDVMNALSPQLLLELCTAFRELQGDPEVRSVILTGAGRAFCAGLDLKTLSESEGGLDAFAIHGEQDVVGAITAFDRPVIMAINGVAATGGFELALMGDILLAGESARFADTHCRVGLAPGWGLSQKLARIIGPSRAREAHFTGNFISAAQAADWGLVSRVVADDALLDEARQVARDIASCVPATVKIYKRLVNEGLDMNQGAALEMERFVMTHANRVVSGEQLGGRREAVQGRGKRQVGD